MISTLPFGSTGHDSTRLIFGAFAFSQVTQTEADRTMELISRYGINHIDTASSYGDSELRLGPWMREHRKQFFLATKTGERRYGPARDEIRRSLERLQVDQVDLLQLHNLVDPAEWEVALGPGGALEAAIEARQEGLVRFIGVTGHGVSVAAMHRRSLERFAFNSVLLPYNYLMMREPQYRENFEALVALCRERQVAVQTIKGVARRPRLDPNAAGFATWYEPLNQQTAIDTAVHWVLQRPGLFLNTVGDIQVLPLVLDAATRFQAGPSEEQMHQVTLEQEMLPLFV